MPTARLQVVAYESRPESELDAIAAVVGDYLLVVVTGVVADRREVVSLGIRPDSLDAAAARKLAAQALDSMEDSQLVALTGPVLRSLSLSDALAARETAAADAGSVAAPMLVGVPQALLSDLDDEDAARMPYLDDALLYVRALRDGRAPSEVIAAARGVGRQAANKRVLLARRAGLLTPARGRTLGGQLTSVALRLERWRADRTTE